MKRAFTLIELLVVIAIIAILAAILFPVFAQAKAAAKKAAAISNQKQIGTSILLYMADFDDYYPRNDDCTDKSALNTALNTRPFNAVGAGCTSAPFHYRMNHYSWQKWVLPYMKNVQVFEHPSRGRYDAFTTSCPNGQWSDCGQIMGSFALNLAVTGALNTYNRAPTALGRTRTSWLGGNQQSIPDPGRAMLLLEMYNPAINYSPVWVDPINNALSDQIVYPMAIREFWAANFMKDTGLCVFSNQPHPDKTVNGQIIIGTADGSARTIPASRFLMETPTAAEIGGVVNANTQCGISSGTYVPGTTPNFGTLTKDYPMWAIQRP